MIDIKQEKSGRVVTVPVNDAYVVSILKNELPHKISHQNFNKYLKEVCKIADINDEVDGYKYNSVFKRKQLVNAPKYQLLTSIDQNNLFTLAVKILFQF